MNKCTTLFTALPSFWMKETSAREALMGLDVQRDNVLWMFHNETSFGRHKLIIATTEQIPRKTLHLGHLGFWRLLGLPFDSNPHNHL